MNSPFGYARLKRWFAAQKPAQFAHKVFLGGVQAEGDTVERPGSTVAVPTLEFNRIYVLLHIYRHLFQEGIGLRQLLDSAYATTSESSCPPISCSATGLPCMNFSSLRMSL